MDVGHPGAMSRVWLRGMSVGSLVVVLGALLPWENFPPEAEAFVVESFRFNPSQWLWRIGLLVLAVGTPVVARTLRGAHLRRFSLIVLGYAVVLCIWMLIDRIQGVCVCRLRRSAAGLVLGIDETGDRVLCGVGGVGRPVVTRPRRPDHQPATAGQLSVVKNRR